MTDPTTPAKGLTQPTVGADNNTWGGLLNTDLALIDSALGGTLSLSISGNTTLTGTQIQNTGYEFTGTLSGAATITWPSFNGLAVIQNGTAGSFSITCGISGGSSVSIPNGKTRAVWSDGTNFVALAPEAPSFTRQATKTSAYTVTSADNGRYISLAGNAFYALTLPAPSTLPNYGIVVSNDDSGRAKWMNFASGATSFYLWPNQVVMLYTNGSAWEIFGKSRWKLPGGALSVYTDFVNGSDTFGATDGLATGTSAFKSFQHALNFTLDQFDWNGTESLQSNLVITGASGTTDTADIHYSPHSNVGAQGGFAIEIDLNGGTIDGHVQSIFPGSVIAIRNGTLQNTGAADQCLQVVYGGIVYVEDNITFGALSSGSAHIGAFTGGTIILEHNYTIASGNAAGYHILNNGGTVLADEAITATFTSSVSFGIFILTNSGNTALGAVTWNPNGHTISGASYEATGPGTLLNGNPTVSAITAGSWDAWANYTPTVSVAEGSFGVIPTVVGRYIQEGQRTFFQCQVTFGNVGSAGGNLNISLPVPADNYHVIAGLETTQGWALTGWIYDIGGSTSHIQVKRYDGNLTDFIVDGYQLLFSGVYESVAP